VAKGVPRRSAATSFEDVDAVFLALAHEARRQILLLLGYAGGELPSGYLAARFSHSWPTTTRHLRVLEAAGLVEVRREGRTSKYRLNRARLEQVVGGWMRHLEPVSPGKKWRPTGARSTVELSKRAGHAGSEAEGTTKAKTRKPRGASR
jgi:DNA-binding transcriptional ArsR family regulator